MMPRRSDFDSAYRQHRAGVHRYAVMLCRSGLIEPEELVQVTFIQAWLIWETRRSTGDLRAWLIGIARFEHLHMLRALRIRPAGHSEQWTVATDGRVSVGDQGLRIYLDQVVARFADLGPAQRLALRGCLGEMTPGEIAAQTGSSAEAVRAARTLGRNRLRKLVDVHIGSTLW